MREHIILIVDSYLRPNSLSSNEIGDLLYDLVNTTAPNSYSGN
jgi:hypothetical protein